MRLLARCRLVLFFAAAVACAQPPLAQGRAGVADIAELWQEPVDLMQRDLLMGPGGAALAPAANATYEFIAHKTTVGESSWKVSASGRT